MKHLFTTTAVAAVLALGVAHAQETQTDATTTDATTQDAATESAPAITPPEGYVEGDVVLTSENLEGATVYDANDDEIGEVHGLVFANGSNSLQEGGTGAADTPSTGAMDDQPTPEAGSVEGATASPDATAPDTASESTNTATGTDTGDNDRITGVGSDSTTITPTDATTPPVQEEGDQAQAMDQAQITHAIIDVGGFLGMGEHRVAVPVDDLQVYSNEADIRIYLPWTREQLEALPEFDEDAATQ